MYSTSRTETGRYGYQRKERKREREGKDGKMDGSGELIEARQANRKKKKKPEFIRIEKLQL